MILNRGGSRYIFMFSIFPIILSATTDFDQGVEKFNKSKWKESYKIFKRLSQNGEKRTDLDFYLGRSAFESGNYKDALIAFERVEIETDPRDDIAVNRVKLELGRTHLALGEFQSAEKIFREVLDNNPPENVKRKIDELLNFSRQKPMKKSHLAISTNLEIGYETNVNSIPSNENMTDFLSDLNGKVTTNTVLVKTEDQKDSLYLSQSGNLGIQFDFSDGWGLSANILGMNQNYFETPENDTIYFTANISPLYRDGSYRFGLPVRFESVKYSNQHLLDSYSIGLKGSRYIETQFVKAIIFDVFTNLKQKDYEKTNSQDSSIWEYGLSSTIKQGQKILFLKYGTEHENSKNNQISNFNLTDKIINTINIAYSDSFLEKTNLSFGYLFRNVVYDDYEALKNYNLKIADGCRLDRFHSLKIGFSKEFISGLSADLRFNYIINDSNHVPTDYSKSIYSFGVTYEF